MAIGNSVTTVTTGIAIGRDGNVATFTTHVTHMQKVLIALTGILIV